jgi:CheY-like chemotaxis protein
LPANKRHHDTDEGTQVQFYALQRPAGLKIPYGKGRHDMDINKDRVLIVDDDPASRELFEEHLSLMGYKPITAKDGEDAIDILTWDPYFDLIITDVMMPYMNGFDFITKLKEIVSTKKIPILATSAHYEWEKIKNSQAIIADGFVPKPIDRNVLLSEIKRVRGK